MDGSNPHSLPPVRKGASYLLPRDLVRAPRDPRDPMERVPFARGRVAQFRARGVDVSDEVAATHTAKPDPSVSARIQYLESANRRQAKQIEELHDAARVLAGSGPLLIESVALCRIVESAIASASADLGPRRPLAVLGAHVECQVLGDVARLEQLVLRLVRKAFASAAGSVHVQIERDGAFALVRVCAGDRCHEEERVIAAVPADPELVLPQAIVDLHGGTLGALADRQGRWRQFAVRLPTGAVQCELPAREDPSVDELSSIDLEGVRALVVDADPAQRDLLTSILVERGAAVVSTSSITEALLRVEDWYPDVVVSDVGLPDGTGYDLIHRVRRLAPDNGGSVPAIALTGYADLEACRRALLAGYQVHVAKPLDDPGLLVQAVANVAGVPIGEVI